MPPTVASKEDVDRVEQKLDKVLELLNGNGKPGIFTRLVLLEQWREQREKEIEKEKVDKEEEAETNSERVWGIVWPMVVDLGKTFLFIILFLIVIHLPGVAALFGFELAK